MGAREHGCAHYTHLHCPDRHHTPESTLGDIEPKGHCCQTPISVREMEENAVVLITPTIALILIIPKQVPWESETKTTAVRPH